MEEENVHESEDVAQEITQPEEALEKEEIAQPEQAVEEEDIPVHEPERDDADDDEICEVTAKEMPASKRQSRGRMAPTIPLRTNPKRKTNEIPTTISPIFTSSARTSPKARRKVVFSQEDEEEPEIGQAEEVASPTSHPKQPTQAITELEEAHESLEGEDGTESWVDSEEGPSVSEQPDEELVVEGPGVEARQDDEVGAKAKHEMPGDGAADEVMDEEKAAKERDRKGKAKALPKEKKAKKKKKRRRRITGAHTFEWHKE